MKKLVLFLLLAVSVLAVNQKVFVGGVSREQFPLVTCEREKRIGSVSVFDERVCCINLNHNYFCENNEPVVGTCYSNACTWPTESFSPWYSWRYRNPQCPGFSVLAGREYEDVLKWAGCEDKGYFWCCHPYAFPPLEPQTAVKNKVFVSTPSPGALMVVDSAKWYALEQGQFKDMIPEQLAFKFEKARCANGGGSVRIIDDKYGSFFKDSKNLKPGMRVFYMTRKEIIPLVSWC